MPQQILEHKVYGAAVAQNVRSDVLVDCDWARAGGDEIIHIDHMGIYGAVTATYGLYKGRTILSPEATKCQTTAFDGDMSKVSVVSIAILPNETLRLFMTDSAADPAGLDILATGVLLKRGVDF